MPEQIVLEIPYYCLRDMRVPELNSYVAHLFECDDFHEFRHQIQEYQASQHVMEVLGMNYRKKDALEGNMDRLIRSKGPVFNKSLRGFTILIEKRA